MNLEQTNKKKGYQVRFFYHDWNYFKYEKWFSKQRNQISAPWLRPRRKDKIKSRALKLIIELLDSFVLKQSYNNDANKGYLVAPACYDLES